MILVTIINVLYWVLVILFLARMVITIARVDPYDPTWGSLAQLVYQITEPILEPVRRLIPPQAGLDFSPMIILLGLVFLQRILIGLL